MTEPSGVIAFACEIGLPPSTSASPRVPNQSVQACIDLVLSSWVSGIEPPWNVSRKFAMPKHLHRAATSCCRPFGRRTPPVHHHDEPPTPEFDSAD